MSDLRLTEKAARQIEEGFQLNREAWRLLDIIVAEWEHDPMSVQCFDLRIVQQAKDAVKRRKEIDKHDWLPIPQRSLDDIWNAILDVKEQLKAINAELSKSDIRRDNDRRYQQLVDGMQRQQNTAIEKQGKVK